MTHTYLLVWGLCEKTPAGVGTAITTNCLSEGEKLKTGEYPGNVRAFCSLPLALMKEDAKTGPLFSYLWFQLFAARFAFANLHTLTAVLSFRFGLERQLQYKLDYSGLPGPGRVPALVCKRLSTSGSGLMQAALLAKMLYRQQHVVSPEANHAKVDSLCSSFGGPCLVAYVCQYKLLRLASCCRPLPNAIATRKAPGAASTAADTFVSTYI